MFVHALYADGCPSSEQVGGKVSRKDITTGVLAQKEFSPRKNGGLRFRRVDHSVGCASACGTRFCSRDPIIRVSDGALTSATCESLSTGAPGLLAENDDSCGTVCAHVTVVGPPSGSIRVAHRRHAGGFYDCEWDVRPR